MVIQVKFYNLILTRRKGPTDPKNLSNYFQYTSNIFDFSEISLVLLLQKISEKY